MENGVTTIYDYTLHGKLITHLTKRVVEESGAETTETLHFFYDAQSRPAFVEYEGEMYRYIHNLQGDIVAIVDSTGNLVVEYKYDAWGRISHKIGCMASTLGHRNPFCYRGYFYDEDTSWMYWVKSRYYCLGIHRFINTDSGLAGGHKFLGRNMYVYTANNPINCIDTEGKKTYFINGINNNGNEAQGNIPDCALDFEREYESMYDDDVVCIPVYVGGDLLSGAVDVVMEYYGYDIYTSYVVEAIRADLKKNPLRENEKITLIGYSGGGILAAKATMHLDRTDTLVLVGAPFVPMEIKAEKIVFAFAAFDLLATNRWGRNIVNYFSGFHGHHGYFKGDYLKKIVDFVGNYSK